MTRKNILVMTFRQNFLANHQTTFKTKLIKGDLDEDEEVDYFN